jgi:serine protease Do
MADHVAGVRRTVSIVLLLFLASGPVGLAGEAPAPLPPPTEEVRVEAGLPAVFLKPAPEGRDDLRAMESHLQSLVEKLTHATVGVKIGRAQGSGVIVSEDGYVLTAAHVSGQPGQKVEFVLHDGRKVSGTTLGRNQTLDAGLMKIEQDGAKWTYTDLAEWASVKDGCWCLATGHPGGYHEGRSPVFRLGRIIGANKRYIQTDCELVGGDSGGPLFDMHGKVIGINSRIGMNTNFNFHVPVSAYSDDWERLASSQSFTSHSGAVLGVSGKPHNLGLEITRVYPGEPAAEAGVRVGDILVTFGSRKVPSIDRLIDLVGQHAPGRRVKLGIKRGDETLEIQVVLKERQE